MNIKQFHFLKLKNPVVQKVAIFGISIIPVLIVFLVVYKLYVKDSSDGSLETATSNLTQDVELTMNEDSENGKSQFDLQTEQFDSFFETALSNLGQEKSSRTEIKNDNETGKNWLTIVRKSHLKHFIPLEKANLQLTKIAYEHNLDLIDALEIRNTKEHFVRLWFGRNDLHTNTVLLYPGEKPKVSSVPTTPGTSTSSKSIRPKLGIIVDDFGAAFSSLTTDFIELPYKLTFAVLPPGNKEYPNSPRIAEIAHHNAKEIMLHLPMEPNTYPTDNPGPTAIYVDHDSEKQRRTILTHINSLEPYVKGVNNHMGSRATESEATMETLMSVLKQKGMYFVDSKTNRRSIAARTAIRSGVGTRENWFFLDPDGVDSNYIEKKLQEAADIARERGSLVVIGHISRKMHKALKNKLPELEKQGVELVFVSEILR